MRNAAFLVCSEIDHLTREKKMRAWYFDEKANDPRDPCVLNDRFINQVIIFPRIPFKMLLPPHLIVVTTSTGWPNHLATYIIFLLELVFELNRNSKLLNVFTINTPKL